MLPPYPHHQNQEGPKEAFFSLHIPFFDGKHLSMLPGCKVCILSLTPQKILFWDFWLENMVHYYSHITYPRPLWWDIYEGHPLKVPFWSRTCSHHPCEISNHLPFFFLLQLLKIWRVGNIWEQNCVNHGIFLCCLANGDSKIYSELTELEHKQKQSKFWFCSCCFVFLSD